MRITRRNAGTLRGTVAESLRTNGIGSYEESAEPVIVALEEREQTIKNGLYDFAVSKGLSGDEVEALFVEVGLSDPAPEPVEPQSIEAMIATLTDEVRSLSSRLDSASEQASRHGIRF